MTKILKRHRVGVCKNGGRCLVILEVNLIQKRSVDKKCLAEPSEGEYEKTNITNNQPKAEETTSHH